MKGPPKKRGTSSQACQTIKFLGFHSFSKVTRWFFFGRTDHIDDRHHFIGREASTRSGSFVARVMGLSVVHKLERGQQPKTGRPKKGSRVGLIYDLRTGPKFMLWLKFACDSSEVWMMLLFDFEILMGRISMLFCLMDVSWSSDGSSWCVETCF